MTNEQKDPKTEGFRDIEIAIHLILREPPFIQSNGELLYFPLLISVKYLGQNRFFLISDMGTRAQ